MRFVLMGLAAASSTVLGFLVKGVEMSHSPTALPTVPPQPIGVTAALLMDGRFIDARVRGADDLPVPAGGRGALVVVGEERDAARVGAHYFVPAPTLHRTTALTLKAPSLEISPRELWKRRDRFDIIDLREEGEFAATRIAGSRRRSMHSDFTDEARPVALFCLTGHRSAAVVESLQARGIRNVYSVRGGWLDWCQQKLPLEWTAPPRYSVSENS